MKRSVCIKIQSNAIGGRAGSVRLCVAPTSTRSVAARRAALLVAVDYPRDSDYHLPGCTKDVDTMRRRLRRSGFAPHEIRVVTNAHATRARILWELRDIVERSASLDFLVVHFSGHGMQRPATDGAESDGLDEVIIPWFTEQITPIDDNTVTSIVRRVAPGCKGLFIFDCCHSGTIVDSAPLLGRRGAPLVCVSACQDHEKALQIRGNGVLTSFLERAGEAEGPTIAQIDQRRVKNQRFACRVLRGAHEADHGIFAVRSG